MDALLIALLLSVITVAGGRSPLLMEILRERFGGSAAVMAGMLCATAVSAVISAWVGALLASLLTPEARSLLLGLAIGAGGLFLLFRPSRPMRLGRIGGCPLLAASLGFLLICLGESAQFIIAAVAAARADPWMAGLGGWIGCAVASLAIPPSVISSPIQRAVRTVASIPLMLIGLFTAMGALRLF